MNLIKAFLSRLKPCRKMNGGIKSPSLVKTSNTMRSTGCFITISIYFVETEQSSRCFVSSPPNHYGSISYLRKTSEFSVWRGGRFCLKTFQRNLFSWSPLQAINIFPFNSVWEILKDFTPSSLIRKSDTPITPVIYLTDWLGSCSIMALIKRSNSGVTILEKKNRVRLLSCCTFIIAVGLNHVFSILYTVLRMTPKHSEIFVLAPPRRKPLNTAGRFNVLEEWIESCFFPHNQYSSEARLLLSGQNLNQTKWMYEINNLNCDNLPSHPIYIYIYIYIYIFIVHKNMTVRSKNMKTYNARSKDK